MSDRFQLRQLGWFARIGVAGIVITLLGGLAASAAYVHIHHAKKDGSPDLSMTDLKGSYHGVETPSLLLETIEAGHPEAMPDDEREALIEWLRGDRIAQDYDRLDLGDYAPAEIIAINCLECHARHVADEHEIARTVPLDYWDDISRMAFPLQLDPPSIDILVVSTHTHALSIATIAGLTMLLLVATSWPRGMVGILIGLSGVALLADISAWWMARLSPGFVYMIVISGSAFLVVTAIAQLAILVDLCRPGLPRA